MKSFKKLLKKAKNKKMLKPSKMIKLEFEKSGKKDYLTSFVSRCNRKTESDIKKFDWETTSCSSLASKISYSTYRYILDQSLLTLGTRYIMERQLNHLQQRLITQHLYHKPKIIGTQVSNQFQNTINELYTPEALEKAIFSNVNQGDAMPQLQGWTPKTQKPKMTKFRNSSKKYCHYCANGICNNPYHKDKLKPKPKTKNENNFNPNYNGYY